MRIALGVEYDGSGFCGWQTQLDGCAVQDRLQAALTQIAGTPVATICAGRTDAGVHALAQVVHFDCTVERPDSAWGARRQCTAAARIGGHLGAACPADV